MSEFREAEAAFMAEREGRHASTCDGWCGHPWCHAYAERTKATYLSDDESVYLIPDSFEGAILEAMGARRLTPWEIQNYNAKLAQQLVDDAMESYAWS